jgi:hypothetical protein
MGWTTTYHKPEEPSNAQPDATVPQHLSAARHVREFSFGVWRGIIINAAAVSTYRRNTRLDEHA